jgi:hypothetical protein
MAYPGDDRILALTRASCWDSHVLICTNINKYRMRIMKCTNLGFIDMISNVILEFSFWDISPPSGHEFNIFEVTFFAFEFKIGINRNVKNIKKPCGA